MRHGRCPHRRPAQARQHGGQVESAIEAVAELPQVARQMLATELMVGTVQAVLDVAEDGVEPLELRDGHAAVAAAGDDDLMFETGAGDARKALESIGQHDGVGVEVAFGETLHLGFAKPGDFAEAQADGMGFVVAGQRREERHLVR